MFLLEYVLFGLLLGFSLAGPPGPMNAWIASVAARSYRAGVLTGLGAMTADALLGTAVYLLDRTLDLAAVLRPIFALGAVVLCLLAYLVLRRPTGSMSPVGDRGTFLQALGIGLSNPFQVVWWLTAGVAFAYLGGVVLLAGLFGAIAVWVVSFPWLVHAGVRRWPSIERGVRASSGAILVAFAIYFAALAILG